MASPLMPMAKVRMGPGQSRAAMPQTSEESRPPLRRKPTFASETRRFFTAATSRVRMPAQSSSSVPVTVSETAPGSA